MYCKIKFFNDEKEIEKHDNNNEKDVNDEKGAKTAKSKKPLKTKKATKKSAAKNNLPGYMILGNVMDRASFLIEQYNKIFPGKDAQRFLNDQVTIAWNNKFFQSTLYYAQYIYYLVRNELQPIELKKYEKLAQFFSFFNFFEIIERFLEEKFNHHSKTNDINTSKNTCIYSTAITTIK